MKMQILKAVLLGLCCTAYADSNATDTPPITLNSADGYWQTIDDSTGKPTAVIAIQTKDNVTTGSVMGGYPVAGKVPHQMCTKCPAPFTNQPVTGMTILWGFHYNQASHTDVDGHILDPNSGNIYHAMLTPENNGQQLKVRGYIGVPLFGRTQVWNRLTTQEYQKFIQSYYPKEQSKSQQASS